MPSPSTSSPSPTPPCPVPLPIRIIEIYRRPQGKDPLLRRYLRFLAAKGFITTRFEPQLSYRGKLEVKAILEICEKVEPKLIQFIPAALIRFPGHFPKRGNATSALPKDLEETLTALRERKNDTGPDFRGHSYASIRSWTLLPTKDRRSSSQLPHRCTLRIKPAMYLRLQNYAESHQIDLTTALHAAIEHLPARSLSDAGFSTERS